MNHTQIIYKNLPEKKIIWSLADKGNFKAVIEAFLKAGVPDHSIGELLFSFADHAIAENKFATAITILIFLTQTLEDKSEAPPLIKKIGDIYALISEHKKAREYYGRLPLTLENIKLCFQTYLPSIDINGLLSMRDMLLSRIPEANHGQIHLLIDDIMQEVAQTPEVFDSHLLLYKGNTHCLKTIPPFTTNPDPLEYDWPSQTAKSWRPEILRLSNTIYRKQDKVWQKIFSNDPQNRLNIKKISDGGSNIMVLCNSPESLFDFITRIKTGNPEFIKYECRVIFDFNLLHRILSVFDLSPLNKCDFIIRFIDKNNLKSQLIHILLERKLPFTNRVVYLSQEDSTFFSKHVIPTIKECEKKTLQNIELYEQQLLKIFPANYQKTVIKKIKAGQKLKILFFVSRFTTYLQHSIRDIAEGFRQLGHKTFIEIEDNDSGVSIRKDVCLENLIEFQPDLIFSIDHMRYSYPWIPKSIPFVTWIQDLMPHLLALNDPSLVTDYDHVFSASQHWIDNVFKTHTVFKKKTIYCLPVIVDTNIYYPLPSYEKKYDITFITHLQGPELTFLPILDGRMIPEIKSDSTLIFLKQLIDDLDDLSLNHLHQIRADNNIRKNFTNEICQKIGIPLSENLFKLTDLFDKNKAYSRFYYHFILLMKTKPIMALIKNNFAVRVFGKNWEKLPQFKNIAMGIAKNGSELNKIINQSRINLNLSPEVSYHMKAPEVIATNSFLLTRRISKPYDLMPITTFFKEGKEVILFDNEYDLINKASFFLKNGKKREAIASEAYHQFIENFSVKKESQFILSKLSTFPYGKRPKI